MISWRIMEMYKHFDSIKYAFADCKGDPDLS